MSKKVLSGEEEVFVDEDYSDVSDNHINNEGSTGSDDEFAAVGDNGLQELNPRDGIVDASVPPIFHSPSLGDKVHIFSKEVDDWLDAVITQTIKKALKLHPYFVNVTYKSSGAKGSAKLDKDSLWHFKDGGKQQYFWWRWNHLYQDGSGGGGMRGARDES